MPRGTVNWTISKAGNPTFKNDEGLYVTVTEDDDGYFWYQEGTHTKRGPYDTQEEAKEEAEDEYE